MAASPAPQTRSPVTPPPASKMPAFDLGSALNEDILSAVNSPVTGGVPNAMNEAPSWQARTMLDKSTPPAREDYVQRWVRVADVEGNVDKANIDEAKRMGWKPRQPDDETKRLGFDSDAGVFSYKGELVLFEMPKSHHKEVMKALNAEEDRINRVIYNQTREQSGLPSRYGSLGFDGGRDGESLVDD